MKHYLALNIFLLPLVTSSSFRKRRLVPLDVINAPLTQDTALNPDYYLGKDNSMSFSDEGVWIELDEEENVTQIYNAKSDKKSSKGSKMSSKASSKSSSKPNKNPKSKNHKPKNPKPKNPKSKSSKKPTDTEKCGVKPSCQQDLCHNSFLTCQNGTWLCQHSPKTCPEGLICDTTDGVCKPQQITEDFILESASWEGDTLLLEEISENQVVWDVAFASKKTKIEGKCTVEMDVNATNGAIQTSDFNYFMQSCSPESVELHITFPRTVVSICFGKTDNCRPVICSLAGESHKINLDGDLSKLSYAPGNNELLFGLNKNCEILEPYYWKEYVDVVIGKDFRAKWSNDELYRMDFDGDGLSNIIEYYGLRLGDMYVDIAQGGHPPATRPDWPFQFPSTATDPYKPDTDGDLFLDSFELLYGMDPRETDDKNVDTDGEGLSDFNEQISGTSPFKADTDGDNVTDFQELEDGTNPLDDSDYILNKSVHLHHNLRRKLQVSNTIPITLTVGDESASHSERWLMRVGNIEHASPEWGKVSSGTYNFQAGVYPVTVRHIDTNYANGIPDYDYTAKLSWLETSEFSHFTVTKVDPDNLLGTHIKDGKTKIDATLGKKAFLRIEKDQEDCNYDTCVECNADSTCQWNPKRKFCERYDSSMSFSKDTPDDCACRKCNLWAQEERNNGLDWIKNLPICPCHVKEDPISSETTPINVIDFEGGVTVTRKSTSLTPDGSTYVNWIQDLNCNPNDADGCEDYHPGAYGCLRASAFDGPHGQQCCYESNGDFISAGVKAAGTPDYYESSFSNYLYLSHYYNDVVPYEWCCNECEIPSVCDLYIGNDPSSPGVRADLRSCEVYSPSVCGDGICEKDKGETCPQDCDPVDAECGDGFCDHGENSTSCPVDCPEPLTTPVIPSDPKDLNAEFLELVSRCANLSDIVYYKSEAMSEKTVRDNYWEYIPEGSEKIADAALISREYDKGRCIVAFRGTNMKSLEDVKQILNPLTRHVKNDAGHGCKVREGWAQAFFGTKSSGEVIKNHYGERLIARINNCIADGLKLVFTGHSQGGAIALVGHLISSDSDPISITFAAPPTFVSNEVGSTGDPCPVIEDNRIYRFINTEHDEIALNYDMVPFVKEFVGQLTDNILTKMFPFLSANPVTVAALKWLVGNHKGPVAVLPPEPHKAIKVYNSQDEIEEPSLWMLDILDFGLDESFNEWFSVHMMPGYQKKIALLSKDSVNGFAPLQQCNFDKECDSGTCESPDHKMCLRLLLNDKYDCDSHEDCVDGRCKFNLFGYESCQPKLDVGVECDRDEDCKSDYCKKPIVGTNTCEAKLENDEVCFKDKHCQSGNCELLPLLPVMKCKPLITSTTDICYKNSQCWTNRCDLSLILHHCAYKVFDGNKCNEDSDCIDGSFCDGVCKKKLGLNKECDDHDDCETGRCDYPARKVCK